MKNFSVFGHTALMLKFLALLLLTLTFFACNKMEHREDAEESQIELFKKSVKSDTITVYEVDGIILALQAIGTEEYLPDDTITLTYTGVALQQNVIFAQKEIVRVVYGDNDLIDGWKIALPYLRKNSSGLLLITYDKGYGKNRVGVVDPYSTLKFSFTAQ